MLLKHSTLKWSFFTSFVKKQKYIFTFFFYLDPDLYKNPSQSTFDYIETAFSIKFDKDLVKFEHCEFLIDYIADIRAGVMVFSSGLLFSHSNHQWMI